MTPLAYLMIAIALSLLLSASYFRTDGRRRRPADDAEDARTIRKLDRLERRLKEKADRRRRP